MIVPGKDYKNFLAETICAYQKHLPGSPGEDYLLKRGITPAAIAYFRLGLCQDPPAEHQDYNGMLCIPYVTSGGIVTVRFRTLDGSGPKYLSLPGTLGESRPFNVRALQRQTPQIFICEGEIDTVTVSQLGVAALGFPGAGSWKPEYWRLFRYRNVTVLADNDDTGAGENFANRAAADIQGCKIIKMPPGHDVNSFYIQEGENALRKHVGLENNGK